MGYKYKIISNGIKFVVQRKSNGWLSSWETAGLFNHDGLLKCWDTSPVYFNTYEDAKKALESHLSMTEREWHLCAEYQTGTEDNYKRDLVK